jgi:hypothetical protein
MIFDVEPLVAYWDSGQEVLDQWSIWRRRESHCVRRLTGVPPPGGGHHGTDGILARRLDYALVLYDPRVLGAPAGPQLMGACERQVRPLLYTRHG